MPFLALLISLAGITLGSPAADLRAKFGDPLLIEQTSDISRTADYLRPDDASGVLRVTERDGVVFAVELERERAEAARGFTDPYGIALGMSRGAVTARRGKPAFETVNTMLYPEDAAEDASMVYRFDGDVVEGIKLLGSGSTAAGNPRLPKLTETPADSYATAILDLSPTVAASDHFRDRFLTVHACDASGRASTNERRDGRTFRIVTATCDDRKRTWFFDITRARP